MKYLKKKIKHENTTKLWDKLFILKEKRKGKLLCGGEQGRQHIERWVECWPAITIRR